jgi:hypothetical protein
MRWLAAALLLCGCKIDLHIAPDASPCMPSTRYFVDTIWFDYISSYECATSGCHAFSGGHGYLRFHPPATSPDPADPFATWPAAWQENYLAAIQLVRCDLPLASRLLTVPEGKADPHPPGDVVMFQPFVDQMFLAWFSAQ